MEVALQIAQLKSKNLLELQQLWLEYFGRACESMNKEFYVSRLSYRIQELSIGGLPLSTQQMLANLYRAKDYRKHTYLPPAGTRIVRTYRGVEHLVKVWNDGFEYNGIKYKNLSAVAQEITGYRISGRYFFALNKER